MKINSALESQIYKFHTDNIKLTITIFHIFIKVHVTKTCNIKKYVGTILHSLQKLIIIEIFLYIF